MAETAYPVKDLDKRVNQVSGEVGGKGTAGLYRHPQSGQEMVTLSDPLFGEVQSNAAVQLGFERVGDAPEGYTKSIELNAVAAVNEQSDSLRGISARLAQLEGVRDRNVELEKEVERLRKENAAGAGTDAGAVAQSVQAAKEAAAANVRDRGQGDATDSVGDPGPVQDNRVASQEVDPLEDVEGRADVRDETKLDETKELKYQNSTELKATALREDVDVTNADTNKKLREAIETARDEKAKESETE